MIVVMNVVSAAVGRVAESEQAVRAGAREQREVSA